MKILDILIIFNVARNDMKPTDAWKFRYIEDIMVNRDGNHQIDTSDSKHTTCIDLKYRYKYENVNLMRFEYRQANNKSGYAYVDVDHVLDKNEVKFDNIDEIENLDYKFLSDEWMVGYDNGDVDFYLRKWVTYKVNIFKDVFDRVMIEIGNRIKSIRFDDNGYVTYIN